MELFRGSTQAESQHESRACFVVGVDTSRSELPPLLPPRASSGSRNPGAMVPWTRPPPPPRREQLAKATKNAMMRLACPIGNKGGWGEGATAGALITMLRQEEGSMGERQHSYRQTGKARRASSDGARGRVDIRKAVYPPGRGRVPGQPLGQASDPRKEGEVGNKPTGSHPAPDFCKTGGSADTITGTTGGAVPFQPQSSSGGYLPTQLSPGGLGLSASTRVGPLPTLIHPLGRRRVLRGAFTGVGGDGVSTARSSITDVTSPLRTPFGAISQTGHAEYRLKPLMPRPLSSSPPLSIPLPVQGSGPSRLSQTATTGTHHSTFTPEGLLTAPGGRLPTPQQLPSHPTAGVAFFGQHVYDRLSFSREEPPVGMTILRVNLV